MVSKKTVHKLGAKTISIKTQSQEKVRISVILSCYISIQKLLCDKKINYVFIPKGLTSILQH